MAPSIDENRVTYFAETDSRNKRTPFGIKAKDRTRHVYIIGKTGMGKSTLLENMAIQDIMNGEGLAFIDPHGKTADLLLDYVPPERIKDVLYFAPFDLEFPISFNVMEDVGVDRRHLVANGLMSAFKKIWVDAWSARMEYILNNILLSLLEYPDSTLIGVNRMLVDKDYRNKVVDNITDPSVKAFWLDEFAKYGERYMQEAGAAIQNKIGQFISNPLVRNIIGQPKSTFDLRKMMDERKIIIVNLSKGMVGEANANLLGSMLITKIYLAAMSRADSSQSSLSKLPNFYLYVDEFQSFANESFADILSEARKYKLNLTIAHQYIEQMSDEVRAAVFGNVGTMIAFRVGSYDAEVLEKEFAPMFTAEDVVNLGFVQIYLKLMIDGISSQPFSAATLPPIPKPAISNKEEIINESRKTYAQPRSVVEKEIRDWHEPIRSPQSTQRSSSRPQGQGDFKGEHKGGERRGEYRGGQDSRQDNRHEQRPHATSAAQVAPQRPHTPGVREAEERDMRAALSKTFLARADQDAEKREQDRKRESDRQQEKDIRRQDELKRQRNKAPMPENVNALRDALASVLKSSQDRAPQNEQKPIEPAPVAPKVPPQPAQEPAKPIHQTLKEVPEDILRKTLHVEH